LNKSILFSDIFKVKGDSRQAFPRPCGLLFDLHLVYSYLILAIACHQACSMSFMRFRPQILHLLLLANLLSRFGVCCFATLAFTARSTAMHLVDPSSIADVGVVVASAAAGALAQFPRIANLQEELEKTKMELKLESEKVGNKMEELESRMFQVDQEFEEQTARFKKKYDAQAKEQLDEKLQKIRMEYEENVQTRMKQYQLEKEIEMEQDKSLRLVEALTGNGDIQAEVSDLRLQNAQIQELNEKLDATVARANEELERLRQESVDSQKKRFIFF